MICSTFQPDPQGSRYILPEPKKVYYNDPKNLIFARKPFISKKNKTGKNPLETSDKINIARITKLEHQKVYYTDPKFKLKKIAKRQYFTPLPVAKPKEKKEEQLTNGQVDMLSGISDPTQKFFLMEMFKSKIALTQDIESKMVGLTPLDKQTLGQALYRLIQHIRLYLIWVI